MVQTGARAGVLRDALAATGLQPISAATAPARPSLNDLPAATAAEVLALYRSLGGAADTPNLRPGGWDLPFAGGLVVELDEELHFNRYRAATLAASWESGLPWTAEYRRHCAVNGHRFLPSGGHRFSPTAAMVSPRWWPSVLPAQGAARGRREAVKAVGRAA
jgi:hypothetical protein